MVFVHVVDVAMFIETGTSPAEAAPTSPILTREVAVMPLMRFFTRKFLGEVFLGTWVETLSTQSSQGLRRRIGTLHLGKVNPI